MKIKIFVIAVVWLLSGSLSAQAQSQPCGCADKKDLIDRLNRVEMAIQEYRAQIEKMKEQEKNEGKPLMWTKERYDKLEDTVNTAMKTVKNPSANSVSAKSNGGDCDFEEINAPTACLRESVTRHEKVHHRGCLAVKDSLSLNETYQMRMRLADFAQEEIFGYLEERKFILSQLQSLPTDCRQNNWVGYIALQRVLTSVDVEIIPPRPRSGPYGAVYGGTKTTKKEDIEIGMVFVRDGNPMSIRAFMASNENSAYTASTEVDCGGAVGWKSGTETITFKSFLKGEDNGDVVSASNRTVLTVNPANQTYNVYTGVFPRVNLTGQKDFSTKTTFAGCRRDQDPPDRTEPFTSSVSFAGYSATNEKIKPGSSDYLEGSRVVRPPDFNKSYKQGNTLTTLTQEIHFRWMLVRLP